MHRVVRNGPDGRVVATASGPGHAVEAPRVRKGPYAVSFFSRVALARQRRRIPERMDDMKSDVGKLAATLAAFRFINRWLGPYRSVLRTHVIGWCRRRGLQEATLLDLGTGAADIPVWLVTAGLRKGIRLRVIAVDHDPRIVQFARRHVRRKRLSHLIDVRRRELSDIGSLPKVDFIYCGNTLHHLREEEVTSLLADMHRQSKRGYIVIDLRRSTAWWAIFWLVSAPFGSFSFIHYDGTLSIARAYSHAELRFHAEEARRMSSAHRFHLRRLFPGRMLLTGTGSADGS